jgi:rhomboid protease GluP
MPGRVVAVWVLLGLNVVMFGVTYLVSFWLAQNPAPCGFARFASAYDCALFVLGWKDNLLISQGQYWRLLTAIFLHGGIFHLFMNAFSLFVLGPDTERIYGTGRFVAIYFVAGLSGSMLSYAFSPSPSVGASGAIFGLIGALAVFFYTANHILGDFGRSQLQGLIAILVINLVFGFSTPGIDNLGHIGGLLGGAVAGWLLVPRYTIEQRMFTPTVVSRFDPRGWAGVAAMVVVLALLAVFIPAA